MSSISVVSLSSFNLLFFTQVLTVLTSSIKYNEYVTDRGKNISIPCFAEGSIMWVKENGNNSTVIQTGKYLVFTNISEKDRGLYICFASVPVREDHTTEGSTELITIISTPAPTPTLTPSLSRATVSRASSKNSTKTMESIAVVVATTSPLPNVSSQTTARTTEKTSATHTNSPGAVEEQEFRAILKVNVIVRTPPGPVSQLYFKASTILGFLIWRFNKSNSGGYPLRSFTAEYRDVTPNDTQKWSRLDPINIAPNVRQMEVYRLMPNTTYEFRIWANNHLGSSEAVTTNVTTLPETKEEGYEDGWDSIELIPNIILNPGFSESDGEGGDRPPRTIIFGCDDDDSCSTDSSDHEPRMEKFKRKVSVFFTGPMVKRI